MKNPYLFPAIILGLIAVVAASYFIFQPKTVVETTDINISKDSMDQSNMMMKKDEESSTEGMMKQEMVDEKMMKNEDTMVLSGYMNYTPEILTKTSTGKRVLFFYATWCPTCQAADANFKVNLSKLPNDLALIKVNYADPETDDSEKELAKKYGITYQHTFVQIDADGKELSKWNGGQINELLAKIK